MHLNTSLTPSQEAVVIELRTALLLPIDDLLVVTQKFLCPSMSRSALDRCLRRHGISNLKKLFPEEEKSGKVTEKSLKTFKDYKPGFVHADIKYLPQMPDEESRKYLFVAIDRATRWVAYGNPRLENSRGRPLFFKESH